MEKMSKHRQLLILMAIAAVSLALLCLTGCGGSCFGCSFGCENEEPGCLSGCSYISDGCWSDRSCYYTLGYLKEDYNDEDSDKILILSCDSESDRCTGTSGCYDGIYCGGCGTCGVFCGSNEGYDRDESTFGCMDGCLACGKTDGNWSWILREIYNFLDID